MQVYSMGCDETRLRENQYEPRRQHDAMHVEVGRHRLRPEQTAQEEGWRKANYKRREQTRRKAWKKPARSSAPGGRRSLRESCTSAERFCQPVTDSFVRLNNNSAQLCIRIFQRRLQCIAAMACLQRVRMSRRRSHLPSNARPGMRGIERSP